MQIIQQAETKMKCIFCGNTTYFADKSKAYCVDCYCKLRNSAHTHDLPKNTPISPMPTGIGGAGVTKTLETLPNSITVPGSIVTTTIPTTGSFIC